ncbi:PREDICTED: sugar transporter SWEET1 [Ceratosolen solmsi marchali]|uniref:Sugar transporter SWEET1 n=1 Tax=Ceratosolen solmsi marchali TaxID=326594 RepID=A0AAJ7DY89_9HYME|nr:PREDICTED: sugar transporter SWEET1 [Ceratosolen solmsi marchali]
MGLEEYKEVVATCAMVSTMGHMLSGTLICKDIYKKGTSKGFDAMPFIGGIGMCIMMLQYALIVKDPIMININLFGILTNAVYMAIYYLYSPEKMNTLSALAKATAFVSLVLGYAQIESKEHIEFRYGVLITALFLILVGSPLMHLGTIIQTKSTEILPFPLIFMGTLVSFQWLIYGFILNDNFVMFQNGVSFTLSLIQLSLFAIYPSTPIDNKEKSKIK